MVNLICNCTCDGTRSTGCVHLASTKKYQWPVSIARGLMIFWSQGSQVMVLCHQLALDVLVMARKKQQLVEEQVVGTELTLEVGPCSRRPWPCCNRPSRSIFAVEQKVAKSVSCHKQMDKKVCSVYTSNQGLTPFCSRFCKKPGPGRETDGYLAFSFASSSRSSCCMSVEG